MLPEMTRLDLSERGPGALARGATARRWAVDAAIAAVVTAAQVGALASWHRGRSAAGPLA